MNGFSMHPPLMRNEVRKVAERWGGVSMSGRSSSRRLRMKAKSAAVSPQAQGKQAARDGKTTANCPYSGTGFGKRHAWLRGFAAERIKMRRAHSGGMGET
jgi:ribosome modulation factor